MRKVTKYFSTAVLCAAFIFAAENSFANNIENSVDIIQYFHQGKFSSEKGEFKMSQNNIHEETLWEKTKEMSSKAWEATKEGTAKAWDKTKELGSDAWDKTKELSGNTGDAIAEKSEKAWDATKEGTAKAWDKTKEVSEDTWKSTKKAADDAGDILTGKNEGNDYNNPIYRPENEHLNGNYTHRSGE